jgi:hypothetical protein
LEKIGDIEGAREHWKRYFDLDPIRVLKKFFFRLLKNARMQGSRNPEGNAADGCFSAAC